MPISSAQYAIFMVQLYRTGNLHAYSQEPHASHPLRAAHSTLQGDSIYRLGSNELDTENPGGPLDNLFSARINALVGRQVVGILWLLKENGHPISGKVGGIVR